MPLANFLIYLALIFTLTIPTPGYASSPNQEKLQEYALNPGWLALGHYRFNRLDKEVESEADNDQFFLTPEGHKNPQQELVAWIRLIESSHDSIPEEFCRFPARYRWIVSTLGITSGWSLDDCSELQKWLDKVDGDTVSLVFASAYLESPSSMFGHSFLRFHTMGEHTKLSSSTINYAADTAERQGVFDFAYRGLFGGFPGVADQLPLFRRIRNYSDNEGRDLIEYYLKFSTEEVYRLKLHLFEIRGRDFEYYFLDENCSYRLLGAINTVKPELNLLSGFEAWAIPIDTIKQLEQHNLVTEIREWPSAQRQLYFHNDFLSNEASELAISIALGNKPPKVPDTYSKSDAARILFIASEYNALLINQDKLDRKTRKTIAHDIIIARLELNTPANWPIHPPLQKSSNGHGSGRYTVAMGYRDSSTFADINYRSAYHTFEDAIFGFNPGAEVVVLNYGIRARRDRILLQELDLVHVKSRTPINSFFTPASWDFGIAYQEKYFSEKNHHVLALEYSRGRSYSIADHIISGLIGSSANISQAFSHNHGIEMLGKISVLKQTEHFSYHLNFQQGKYISGTNSATKALSITAGIPFEDKLLSLEAKRQASDSSYQSAVEIGFHQYF